MRFLGYSNYQDRKMRFYARQMVAHNLRFQDRYFVAEWLFALLFGIALIVLDGPVFHDNPYYIIVFILLTISLLALLLAPLRIRMWRQWYINLNSKDKQELHWLWKRQAQYTALFAVIAIVFLAILLLIATRNVNR